MSTMSSDLKAAKKAMRREIRQKVAQISLDNKIEQSKIVTLKVLRSEEYKNATSLSIYLHMEDEIRTLVRFFVLSRG